MRVIETKAYKFDELSSEAQDKAVNNLRESEGYLDYEWWDFIYENHKEKIEAEGFYITNMYFRGFHSQGDGAMFEYDGLDDKLLHEAVDSLSLPNWKKSILKNACINGKGKQSGHHYHENSCSHSIDIEFDSNMQGYDNIEMLFDMYYADIEDFIESKYRILCNDLYTELYNCYEDLLDDEVLTEHLLSNEYEFTEEGELV